MKRADLIHQVNSLGLEVFTVSDLRRVFPAESNLRHSIKRLKDAQSIISVTRGYYRLAERSIDVEKFATQLYYPSYISFETVLSKHGVINQGTYTISLATTRHSKKVTVDGIDCVYSQLKQALFFGFRLVDGVYLADVEKALLDELYLIVLGKRKINFEEWDCKQLNKTKIKQYASSYPSAVKKLLARLGLV